MRQHVLALQAAIGRVPQVAGKVFISDTNPVGLDGQPAPDPEPPYVVIHPTDGTDSTDRVAGPKRVMHPRATFHTVGRTWLEASAIGGAIKQVLVPNGFGIRLDVPGETTGALWYSSPVPIQHNDEGPVLFYEHVAETGFESSPN